MNGYTIKTGGVNAIYIKMHIVLSELKKVETLLHEFQERFCQVRAKSEQQRICGELGVWMMRDGVELMQRELVEGWYGV